MSEEAQSGQVRWERTDRGLPQERTLLTQMVPWWLAGMCITVRIAAPRKDGGCIVGPIGVINRK